MPKIYKGEFGRFLRWLAMTDETVLQGCSQKAQMMQPHLGLTVLLTGLLATCSGGYAAYVTFESTFVSVLVGLLYGALIMSVDRFVVAATNHWSALARLLLALAIGIVIAVPLELRIFKDRIDRHLEQQNREENAALLASLRDRHQIPERQARLDSLQQEWQVVWTEVQEARQMQVDEITGTSRPGKARTGKAGPGRAWEAAVLREEAAREDLVVLDLLMREAKSDLEEAAQEVNQDYEDEEAGTLSDLLSSYVALGEIKAAYPDAMVMAWGVRLLLILIELCPALLKVLRPKNDYETAVMILQRVDSNWWRAWHNAQFTQAQSKQPKIPKHIKQTIRQTRRTSVRKPKWAWSGSRQHTGSNNKAPTTP